MISSAALMWSVLFGSIGFGYLLYGKQQKNILAFATGFLLIIFPYFLTSTLLIVVVGILLVALPYLVNKLIL